jgi:hypothetical protein
MAWQWCHFLLASYSGSSVPNHVKPIITNNYHVNSKSGVDFQVALNRNNAEGSNVIWDLPVLYFMCSTLFSLLQNYNMFCTNTIPTLKRSGWPLYPLTFSHPVTQRQRILHKPTTTSAFHSIEVGRHLLVTWFETGFTVVAVTMCLSVLYSNLPPDL